MSGDMLRSLSCMTPLISLLLRINSSFPVRRIFLYRISDVAGLEYSPR